MWAVSVPVLCCHKIEGLSSLLVCVFTLCYVMPFLRIGVHDYMFGLLDCFCQFRGFRYIRFISGSVPYSFTVTSSWPGWRILLIISRSSFCKVSLNQDSTVLISIILHTSHYPTSRLREKTPKNVKNNSLRCFFLAHPHSLASRSLLPNRQSV